MLMSNACVKLQAKIGLFGSREEGKNVKSFDMCMCIIDKQTSDNSLPEAFSSGEMSWKKGNNSDT